MAISTDAALLTLVQWFSPAFPVGAFHFSHGLEAAVLDGEVPDSAALEGWSTEVLRWGAGRVDACLLAASYRCGTDAARAEIDHIARARAASRERLIETTEMGAAFARAVSPLLGADLPPRSYPVAVGEAACRLGLPLEPTSQTYLQAFTANLISAGIRLGVTGQTDGQRIIAALAPLCREIASESLDGDLDGISATTFLSDLAAMRHETLYSRMFRT
ncbi:urease accessory protein UreF [Palleronia caenipelagi]|nr:urease accessory UreF family protein [Palleronia caenipelagi]